MFSTPRSWSPQPYAAFALPPADVPNIQFPGTAPLVLVGLLLACLTSVSLAALQAITLLPAWRVGVAVPGPVYVTLSTGSCPAPAALQFKIGNLGLPAPFNSVTINTSPNVTCTSSSPKFYTWNPAVADLVPNSVFNRPQSSPGDIVTGSGSSMIAYTQVPSEGFTPIASVGYVLHPTATELYLLRGSSGSSDITVTLTPPSPGSPVTTTCLLDGTTSVFWTCNITSEFLNVPGPIVASNLSISEFCETNDGQCSSYSAPVAYVWPSIESNTASLPASGGTINLPGATGLGTGSTRFMTAGNGFLSGTVNVAGTPGSYSFTTSWQSSGELRVTATYGSGANTYCYPVGCNPSSSTASDYVVLGTVYPVVTTSADKIYANATTLTLGGYGFGGTTATNVSMDVSGDWPCTVSQTIDSSRPSTGVSAVCTGTVHDLAGPISASVTVNGQSSGSAVQVATVYPFVSASSTAYSAKDTTQLTINGNGFGSTIANVAVQINSPESKPCSVSSASPTQIICAFGTNFQYSGSLVVTVTVTNAGAWASDATTIGTVYPVITSSELDLLANGTLHIDGFGFLGTPFSMTLSNNAVCNTPTRAGTTIDCSFSTQPRDLGAMNAVVNIGGQSSGTAVNVSTIVPVLMESTSTVESGQSGAGAITIYGAGFFQTGQTHTLTTTSGASCTISNPTSASPYYSATCTFDSPLVAVGVISGKVGSGAYATLGYVKPFVTANTADRSALASTISFTGSGFDDSMTVSWGFGVTCLSEDVSADKLTYTCTVNNFPTQSGALAATVSFNGQTSTSKTVATILPAIDSDLFNVHTADSFTSYSFTGAGFAGGSISSYNVSGVGCTSPSITAVAGKQQFSCTTTIPSSSGYLAIVVTGASSKLSPATVIAVISPVITELTTDREASAGTIAISGYGFGAIAASVSVELPGGFAACHPTEASGTSLTCTFDTKPQRSGILTAIATVNNVSSAEVTIATIHPSVYAPPTLPTYTIAPPTPSALTISGNGFDAASLLVQFDNPGGTSCQYVASSLTYDGSTGRQSFACSYNNNGPTAVGALRVTVSSNTYAALTAQVQVGWIVHSVIADTQTLVPANATQITIKGNGFANSTDWDVSLNNGAACTINTILTGTGTGPFEGQIICDLDTKPQFSGALTATVTYVPASNYQHAAQVATITPVLTENLATVDVNAGSITINGFGLKAATTSSMNPGYCSSVSPIGGDGRSFSCTLATTAAVGPFVLTVSVNGQSSVPTIVRVLLPVVASSGTQIAGSVDSITFNGAGFTPTGTITITSVSDAVCVYQQVSTTQATCSFTALGGRRPAVAGPFTITLNIGGYTNAAPITIANIKPVVTPINPNVVPTPIANPVPTTLQISGYALGGSPVEVGLANLGAAITCTSPIADSTGTSLTCTLTGSFSSAGMLRASVTYDSAYSSGTAVDVLKLGAVVTENPANISACASSVTVAGFGFLAGSTDLVLTNGASCNTISGVSYTGFTCNFAANTRPTTSGNLAITSITVKSIQVSPVNVQIATVVPQISVSGVGNWVVQPFPGAPLSFTINGCGLLSMSGTSLSLNAGCTLTNNQATSVLCTLAPAPREPGQLWVAVTVGGQTSPAILAANVKPALYTSTQVRKASNTDFPLYGTGLAVSVLGGVTAVSLSNGATCPLGSLTPGEGYYNNQSLICHFASTDLPTTSGAITASVTVNGQISLTQPIAIIQPEVTESTTQTVEVASFGSGQVTINGFALYTPGNFAPGYLVSLPGTSPLSNVLTVVLPKPTDGKSLTYTLSASMPKACGALTYRQTALGVTPAVYSTPVVIGYVLPSIQSSASTYKYARSADRILIYGVGDGGFPSFQSAPIVTLSSGACTAQLTSGNWASPFTCVLTSPPDENDNPLRASIFVNNVTSNEVAIATILPDPIITPASDLLAINSPRITIEGSAFGAETTDFVVTFSHGAGCLLQSVVDNAVVCTFSPLPQLAGATSDIFNVSISKFRSAPILTSVRTLVYPPLIIQQTGAIENGVATEVTISGTDLGNDASEVQVQLLSDGGGGYSRNCTPSLVSYSKIVCAWDVAPPLGSLKALIARAGGFSNTAIIGTVADPPRVSPVANLTIISHLQPTLDIIGQNFYWSNPINPAVYEIGISGPRTCSVTSVTPDGTRLTCTINNPPLSAGVLQVLTLASNGLDSPDQNVPIYQVTESPVIQKNTIGIPQAYVAGQVLTITGSGFSSIQPSDNLVTLKYCSSATAVTQCVPTTASSTSIECTFQTSGNFAFSSAALCAIVKVISFTDPSKLEQIATIRPAPVITANSAAIAQDATTFVVTGSHFSDVPSSNVMELFPTGTCTVSSEGLTSNSLTCIASGLSIGTLSGIVTVDGRPSIQKNLGIVVRRPAVTPTTKSILVSSTQVRFYGVGLSGATSASLVLDETTANCATFTAVSDNELVCNLASGAFLSTEGLVYLSQITVQNTVSRLYNPPIQVASVRYKPTITNTLLQASGEPLHTFSLTGTYFSSVLLENKVLFNHGSCTLDPVTSNPPTTLACLYNPNEIPSGVLTATVVVLDGVSSDPTDIIDFSPYLPPATRSIPIDSVELVTTGYWITTNVNEIQNITFSGAHSSIQCNVTASSSSSITCDLGGPFSALGPLLGTVFINDVPLQTTFGTVVPSLYDSGLTFPADQIPADQVVTMWADGLSLGSFSWLSDSLPENFIPTLQCNNPAVDGTTVTCTLSATTPTRAGTLYAAIAIAPPSGGNYRSNVASVVNISPVLLVNGSTTITSGNQILIFEGYGFATEIEDNTIILSPSGKCNIIEVLIASSWTTDKDVIRCQIVPDSLVDGDQLSVLLISNGISTPQAVMAGTVVLPTPSTTAIPEGGPNSNDTTPESLPVDNFTPFTTGPNTSIVEGLDDGAIAAIVVVFVLLALAGLAVAWYFILRKKFPKTDFMPALRRNKIFARIMNRVKGTDSIPLTTMVNGKARPTHLPSKAKTIHPSKPKRDTDLPPPPPPEDDDDIAPPPPEDDDIAPPPPEEDDDAAPPPPEDADDDDAPPPPEDDEVPKRKKSAPATDFFTFDE